MSHVLFATAFLSSRVTPWCTRSRTCETVAIDQRDFFFLSLFFVCLLDAGRFCSLHLRSGDWILLLAPISIEPSYPTCFLPLSLLFNASSKHAKACFFKAAPPCSCFMQNCGATLSLKRPPTPPHPNKKILSNFQCKKNIEGSSRCPRRPGDWPSFATSASRVR